MIQILCLGGADVTSVQGEYAIDDLLSILVEGE